MLNGNRGVNSEKAGKQVPFRPLHTGSGDGDGDGLF